MIRKLFVLLLPVAIIDLYRLIPASVRTIWSMGSSSSGRARDMAFATGNGWSAIARYANPIQARQAQNWDN